MKGRISETHNCVQLHIVVGHIVCKKKTIKLNYYLYIFLFSKKKVILFPYKDFMRVKRFDIKKAVTIKSISSLPRPSKVPHLLLPEKYGNHIVQRFLCAIDIIFICVVHITRERSHEFSIYLQFSIVFQFYTYLVGAAHRAKGAVVFYCVKCNGNLKH